MNKKIIGLISLGLSVTTAALALSGCANSGGKYKEDIEKTKIFTNKTSNAIPQTAVYSIVKEHFDSPLSNGKTDKKALVLFLDGCRVDAVPFVAPYGKGIMKASENGGIYFTYAGGVKKSFRTDTVPGFASMLTGKWADTIDMTDNSKAKGVEPLTCVTELAKRNLSVSFLAEWDTHINLQYKAEFDWAKEQNLDLIAETANGDIELHDKILNSIDTKDIIFGLYSEPDSAGHGFGFSAKNPNYISAVVNTNSLVDEAIEKVYARESYKNEDWLILVTTDHGGHGKNHYQASVTERLTWLAVNKKLDVDKYTAESFKL